LAFGDARGGLIVIDGSIIWAPSDAAASLRHHLLIIQARVALHRIVTVLAVLPALKAEPEGEVQVGAGGADQGRDALGLGLAPNVEVVLAVLLAAFSHRVIIRLAAAAGPIVPASHTPFRAVLALINCEVEELAPLEAVFVGLTLLSDSVPEGVLADGLTEIPFLLVAKFTLGAVTLVLTQGTPKRTPLTLEHIQILELRWSAVDIAEVGVGVQEAVWVGTDPLALVVGQVELLLAA